MNEPKFKPGDVVTWDGGKCAGVVDSAYNRIIGGGYGYRVNKGSWAGHECDLTLLHRPSPEPVRDPVREAGYPWVTPQCNERAVNCAEGSAVAVAFSLPRADRIVALSKLPGVLHEIADRADDHYADEATNLLAIRDIARRALESVGVKL